ncbi:hypothetical protein DC498_10985 [Terrimonas sp.]|uniref:hypothetical protein n=1 Tax=Terrimonas sp. TaxID=1914338 RepID=UPI000D52102D|nr:hypothetical protein [Terrimonas sp.]PVD52240.1 hypothetical protein DC498_10985 [Terrimonas sp.]
MTSYKSAESRFHHMGIPTTQVMPGERYSAAFKMYTSDSPGQFRIQFHRFEEDSPLHPIIQKLPHVAFQVDNLLTAIANKKILLGPYEPIAGYKVAIIDDAGVPVELIQTDLTAEALWRKSSSQEDLDTSGLSI